jgi:predicted nucleic acid-binding protein
MPRPLAVLDANVLFPFQLRNFLLHLATESLYDPLWSERIVDEFARHLVAGAYVTRDQVVHLIGQMRRVFVDAWGTEYESHIDDFLLPDPDDRHVLALAVHYEAEYIVTLNRKHFPEQVLRPLGIEVLPPDAFVELLAQAGFAQIRSAAEKHRLSLKRQPLAPQKYIDSLRRAGLTHTAEQLVVDGFVSALRPLQP